MGDGFLGYDTSVMLDVVVVALLVVVPVLMVSLLQVRFRRRHLVHRRLQLRQIRRARENAVRSLLRCRVEDKR